jgi:hypothetical protein
MRLGGNRPSRLCLGRDEVDERGLWFGRWHIWGFLMFHRPEFWHAINMGT